MFSTDLKVSFKPLILIQALSSLISLGGALATLFAFFASTPKYAGYLTPHPLTCVSFASPRVGDYNFRCAFMHQGKYAIFV
jgi:hypothetical protein